MKVNKNNKWHDVVVQNKVYSFQLDCGVYGEPKQEWNGIVYVCDDNGCEAEYLFDKNKKDIEYISKEVQKIILRDFVQSEKESKVLPQLNTTYQTRDGRTAKIISTDRKHPEYKIVALVQNGDSEAVEIYTHDGHSNVCHAMKDRQKGIDIILCPLVA